MTFEFFVHCSVRRIAHFYGTRLFNANNNRKVIVASTACQDDGCAKLFNENNDHVIKV